jgi:S-disulfanyl-L-cysteine oxidoreductase SoxD
VARRSTILLVALLLGGCRTQESAPAPRAQAVKASPAAAATAPPSRPRFGFGRPASAREIAAWDIDVGPDGSALPPGRGTVAEGERIYAEQCAVCHGVEGKGGKSGSLAGRLPGDAFPFGTDTRLLDQRTIGNYWPYAPTLYDYINRAMPQPIPGSLRPDEVYSVVAYLLFLNQLVAQDVVMDAATLRAVKMPARDRFVIDDRRGGPEVR